MNKKGFTLIEVLAALIVIIIVLVISVPIVTNVINGTTRSAFSSDAKMILNSLRIHKDANPDFDLTTVNKENLLSYQLEDDNYESLSIVMEENEPYIFIVGKEKWTGLKVCGTYRNMNVYSDEETGVCLGEETSGDPIVVFQNDPNPGIICGEGLVEDYVNNDKCYIYSVADLVAFSHSVNNGNNYLGKTVELVNDIDIEDNSTYGDVNLTGFGDINGNGSTETLDIELTTGEGFIPIGNNTINFQGTFEGNARTISNLYINRPTRQYTGLFGYNNGNIYGLNVIELTLSGSTYTGGITGYNNGTVSDIYLQGSITGYGQYIGGLVGYNATTKSAISLLAAVNVEAFEYTYVGGLIGRNFGIASGIVKSGIINSTGSSTYVGKGYGYLSGGVVNVYYSNGVSGVSAERGTKYDVNLNDNLNGYDVVLDTWIGGDNNSNGHYFDYNASGEIVIKSVKDYPMTFDLTGAGTVESPYIISNYSDWKKATLRPNSSYVYSLETDIDFNGNNYYYAMGSNANYFSGTFNGNGHTLSNITTTNLLNSGTFGYNNGNIYGLQLTGLNLKGNTYTGGITGYNNGTVSDISVQGNITSFGAFAGGVVGYNVVSKNALSLLADVNVEGYANQYLGGLIGRNYGVASGIIEAGVVNSSNYDSGKGYGHASSGATTSLYYSSGVTGTAKERGTKYDVNLNDNLNGYDVVLDTWIGGDNNSNGHYFDYNASGEIVIRSVKEYPMVFNLTGAGTVESPYIISNYSDWKKATLRPNSSYVYSLETDIDFNGNNYYYAMGSNANYFSGTFNGNGHTLSNITTTNLLNSGIFGYNNGNIYGLKLTGLNLKGNTYTGGITGYNNGTVSDISVQGNITSFGVCAGGVVGYNVVSKNALSLLADVNIEASTNSAVGGIAGSNAGTVSGILKTGNINVSNYDSGKGYGYASSGATTSLYYSSGVTGTAKERGTKYDVNLNDNLNGYDVVLDTWIGGDNNSNGHYFDYNASGEIVIKSVKDYPMTFDLTGAGTVESPYIISNYNDWKKATLRPNSSYVYSLETDIDFSENNYYYAMGSGYGIVSDLSTETSNHFSGTFEGNAHTLSNITTKGIKYSGTFGYNTGIIRGINIINLNFKGNVYSGGITGFNSGDVSDISVQGNIEYYGTLSGGIIGYNHTSKNALSLLADVNVEGYANQYLGGLIGRNYGVASGIIEAGVVNSSNYDSGKGYGHASSGATTSLYYSSGVTGTARARGTQFDVSNYNNLTSYATYGLETVNTGDIDGNGYYFDYNSDQSDIIVVKAP